ncbi:shufflon system plasmid conjugative transfer pilus tip adhesin PilV [Pandoraea sp. ISTKB]|uniref:shufflon system plasmid conjugative transfer pilus tip adhesin PilV n=1 Tax=Pandoraea sp. ISTKB TaxID=1586708 RepID=UPI0008462A4E|nr:shufflon system plasmid conjugative transfer pilus tip adhesin PilV [Pandoraea sp. ISTKB]ODP35033.1 hypothetical protein A9762_11755 [Pandoraea sp. ISTKB]
MSEKPIQSAPAKCHARSRLTAQRGVIGLEVAGAITIVLALIVLAASWATVNADNQENALIAGQLKLAMTGADKFVKDNAASIAAGATPVVYNWAQIAPSMPQGLSSTNSYGQTYQLAIQRTGTAPNYTLNPLLQTVGGNPIPEKQMRAIAKMAGTSGGFVSALSPGNATGAGGGWTAVLSDYGANPATGHLAAGLFYQNAAQANQYLYRVSVPGKPEVNRMETNIDLNSHDINNGGTVNATKVNLPTGMSVQIGKTYLYGDDTNSAIYQAGTLYVRHTDGSAAPVWMGDANVNGNTYTSGETYTGGWYRSTGANGWYNQTYNGGWYMADPTWVRSYADKNVYTGGQMLAGSLRSYGGLTMDGIGYVGGSCTVGTFVRDPSGRHLSCVNGYWSAGGISSVSTVSSGWAQYGASVQCPAGTTVVGGSCGMERGGDGRVVGAQICYPSGNGWACSEGNTGNCIAYAQCAS